MKSPVIRKSHHASGPTLIGVAGGLKLYSSFDPKIQKGPTGSEPTRFPIFSSMLGTNTDPLLNDRLKPICLFFNNFALLKFR
jgi:hypothetical protein